jgi:hypothetical protein
MVRRRFYCFPIIWRRIGGTPRYNRPDVAWFYGTILSTVAVFLACIGVSYWSPANGHPTVVVAVDLIVRVLIWGVVSLVAGAVLLFVLWMMLDGRRVRERLAQRPCPHCCIPLGHRSAAGRRPVVDGVPEEKHSMVFHVSIDAVKCESCGEVCYFYPETGDLSADLSPVHGIPESSRPLPASLVEPTPRSSAS